MYARHAKAQHPCSAVFELAGEVVQKGHVDAEQRGESLIDTHLRHVVHAARHRISGGGVGNESQPVHVFHVGAVTAVAAHGIDTLVSMVEVDALEYIAEPRQFHQPTITHRPVG